MKCRTKWKATTVFSVIVVFVFFSLLNMALAICTISTSPVSFGSYNVLLAGAHDTQSSLSIGCNETPPATVTVSIGASPNSGGFNPRRMKISGGSELINYNLYIDSARTQIWGDGTGNTFTLTNMVFKRAPWTPPIYGRIPPGQNVGIGSYNETLTVTIVW